MIFLIPAPAMGCLSFPFMPITAALTVEQDKHHYHTNTISYFAHTAYSSINWLLKAWCVQKVEKQKQENLTGWVRQACETDVRRQKEKHQKPLTLSVCNMTQQRFAACQRFDHLRYSPDRAQHVTVYFREFGAWTTSPLPSNVTRQHIRKSASTREHF